MSNEAAWQEAPRAIEYHFQGPGLDIVVDRPEPFNGEGGFGYQGWAVAINGEVHWCTSVSRMRDGGTTFMETKVGVLFSPARIGQPDTVKPEWRPSRFGTATVPLERVRVPVPFEKFKTHALRLLQSTLTNIGDWSDQSDERNIAGWRVESEDGHVLFIEVT